MKEARFFEKPEGEKAVAEAERDVEFIQPLIDDPESVEGLRGTELKRAKEAIESLPDYASYKNQRINFETFDSLLDDFDRQAGTVDDKETKGLRVGLEELVHDAKGDIGRYYNEVNAMDRLRIQKFRMSDEEYYRLLSDKDKTRRATHNALVSDLAALSRLCGEKLPEHGVQIPSNKFFSEPDLLDREKIGDWAYKTEKGSRLVDIVGVIDGKLAQGEKPKTKKRAA